MEILDEEKEWPGVHDSEWCMDVKAEQTQVHKTTWMNHGQLLPFLLLHNTWMARKSDLSTSLKVLQNLIM